MLYWKYRYQRLISNLINYILLIIPILINVAFITLLERKILGYSQIRKGPNKVRLIGICQPFNDAIKLFSKEIVVPNFSNLSKYMLSPRCALFIVLTVFLIIPFKEAFFSISISFLFMYIIIRINVYPVLISGWASNRKYALIGSLRAVAQTVSYEVILALILIFFLRLRISMRFSLIIVLNSYWCKWLLFIPIAGVWLVSCLAETNRTPFDFAEGESELVSGFNIEYGRIGFALIFMAEYARIIFICIIFSLIFLSRRLLRINIYISIVILISIWIWVRSTFPRYRYDKLINLAWKVYLPLTLIILIYVLALIRL